MVVYGVIVNICNILGISWACSFYYISSSPPFWHQGTGFMEDSFSMDQGRGGGGCFWDDSGTSHLLWISFLLLLYQLHLRSWDIRFRRFLLLLYQLHLRSSDIRFWIFLSLLYQLHLRSSDIRFRRFATPDLDQLGLLYFSCFS